MNKIYIILILSFVFFKIQAQKAPCDYKKQDWQTAVTNKDGSIYYQVETSSCNGNDICGEPKIILKHTFSKPAWFIIRLRGVDCSGRTLESEFHTGSKSIQPDIEFASAKNWHIFKEVLKVVHVEVSYEKITEEVFHFDEKEEELKAVQAKKLEEEKRLAEEQSQAKKEAAVANNNKKTTPPKANNPKQTPPAKQPASPSVKKENTVEKPKTNDAVVAQGKPVKPKTQPTKQQTPPSVKKDIGARKPETNDTVVAQNKPVKPKTQSAKPQTTPSIKKEENIKKEKTEEMAKPAEKPIKQQSLPPTQNENSVAEQPVDVKPKEDVVPQPAPLKPDESKIAEERVDVKPDEQGAKKTDSPMVKYENSENPASAVVIQHEEKVTTEMPKEVVPTVDSLDLALNKSNTSDNKNLVDSNKVNRYNVLKTNIFYPLSLGYERGFGQHFSVVINGFYLPSFSYGKPTGSIGYIELLKPSTGFALEARYYTAKTKAALNGMYIGGYYSMRRADVYSHSIKSSTSETTDTQLTAYSGLYMLGAMIGSQRIRAKGFTTDISLGLGFYNIPAVPLISDAREEPFKTYGWVTKYKRGIGPRVTWSLGYAF